MPGRLAAALRGIPDATFLDIGAQSNAIVGRLTRRAGGWLGGSAAAALLLLAIGLRDPWRVARVAGAIIAAGLVTVALLTAAARASRSSTSCHCSSWPGSGSITRCSSPAASSTPRSAPARSARSPPATP